VAGAATLAVPLVVLALAVALGMTLWGRGDLNRFICDGDCGPSHVIAPEALVLRDVPVISPPDVTAPGPIDPAKVEAAVRAELDDSALGPRVGFAALGVEGDTIAPQGEGAFAPASTTKVLTGFAALATIDPGTRFTTQVVRSGDGVVLVGGGDPYLSTKPARRVDDRVFQADLTTLARRTAASLKKTGTTTVTLGHDASLFTGPDASPAWEPGYVRDNIVTPVSALWVDRGVTDGIRARDPSADAARTFAALLAERGITVSGDPATAVAAPEAEVVARVHSATIAQIVETVIRISDNEAAEVVLRHVAIAAGRPADFDGGTAAVRAALESAGVTIDGLVLGDGSGLSRRNRISPVTLVEALGEARSAPRTSGLMSDLPVSGFTGTLVNRFATMSAARGTVRAKTGTLTGIHSLAGYATDADGRPVLFALMADRTDKDRPLQAQAALDRAAAAIVTCSCGA
jgi:D-alanyl-D-alanine carboxypeptidase/D-alanyl-D-alanine-endopeptidase (penicillin-binding protein 4)